MRTKDEGSCMGALNAKCAFNKPKHFLFQNDRKQFALSARNKMRITSRQQQQNRERAKKHRSAMKNAVR